MSDFRVITDSSSDIPKELLKKYNIEIVPLKVILPDDNTEISDDYSIERSKIIEIINNTKKHPSTSLASTATVYDIYTKLEQEGAKTIVYVTMASSLTGTYNNALLAKKIYLKKGGKADILIFDSKQASMGIGIIAIKAVKLLEQGLRNEQLIEALEAFRKNELKSVLTFLDFKYMLKGGRVSYYKYALTKLLKVIPLLEGTLEGKLAVFNKTRKYDKAIQQMIDYAVGEIKNPRKLACYLIDGDASEGIKIAQEYLAKKYPQIAIKGILPLSPVIYVHTGIGTVAFIIFNDFDY